MIRVEKRGVINIPGWSNTGPCYDLLTAVKTVSVKDEFRKGAATEI